MRRNWLILIPVSLVLVLGVAGLSRAGADGDLATHVYLVLQLFALEGDWTREISPLTPELELARFLAPVTTVGSLLFVFASQLHLAIDNALARFSRGHVVVAGLSEPVLNFLIACARRARRVTVLAPRSVDETLVARTRGLGHRVQLVDHIDEAALANAGVPRASHLVAFGEDDGGNVEVALRAKRLVRDAPEVRGAPLQLRLHLEDMRLALRLEDYPKFFEDYAAAETSFFNVHERSARLLFATHAMEQYADALGAEGVHFALVGTGPLAEQVLLQAIRQAHYGDGEAPRVSWVADDANQAIAQFAAAYPGATDVARIDCVNLPASDADLERHLAPETFGTVTAWVVCLEPDVSALRYALALRRAVLARRGGNGPIFVAMRHGHGLARLLESGTGEPEIPDGIFPFAMLDEALADDQILDERQDVLAREIHEAYLAGFDEQSEASMHVSPAYRSWAKLPEVFRRENRLQADHLESKLRACDRQLSETGGTTPPTDAEIERLAELEQRRWVATRRSSGWRVGPVRSDLDKVHDALLPWGELPEAKREQNRAAVRSLIRIAETRLARHARPCVFVGVSGHRPPRLGPDPAAIERALEKTFAAIRDAWPDHRMVLLSPLAEGADRLAARVALDGLDAELHVPLPLPYELYVGSFGVSPDFDRGDSSAEFRELVGRATRYFEMPLRFGSFAELADPQAEALRARQYALCGGWLVSRAHEFVAVWDGDERSGEGGTSEVLRWRRQGVPADYAFDRRFVPDRGQAAPWIVPTLPPADFQPARTA